MFVITNRATSSATVIIVLFFVSVAAVSRPRSVGTCRCPHVAWPDPAPEPYDVTCVKGTSFKSSCHAKCAGHKDSTFEFGPCGTFSVKLSAGCKCTKAIKAVCVETGLGITNYANKCHAACDGYNRTSWREGACRVTCPQDLNPVCAGGRTFRNGCVAWSSSGYLVSKKGACGATNSTTRPPAATSRPGVVNCGCPAPSWQDYKPICIDGTTFESTCYAECVGRNVSSGIPGSQCDIDAVRKSSCRCPDAIKAVCVETALGMTTYRNECHAACEGYNRTSWRAGACGVICADDWDPVCAGGKTFSNGCTAWSYGGLRSYTKGECDAAVKMTSACKCPKTTRAVCVEVGLQRITYGNECHAACEGHARTSWREGPCDTPLCPWLR